MNDMVGIGDDPAREELLAQADAALALRLHGAASESARTFFRRWASGLSTAELAARPAEELAGAALSLWDFMQVRTSGIAKIRVFNPRGRAEGWRSPYAMAELVNDDMPFLVDTALAALQLLDQPVQQLVHPVVTVTRDAEGKLLTLGEGGHAESLTQIAFGPEGDEAVLAQVEATLVRAMADERAAVTDFGAIRARLAEVAGPLPAGPEKEFLTWLGDNNFILLGYRLVELTPQGTLLEASGAGLGLLRDPAVKVFDGLDQPGPLQQQAVTSLQHSGLLGVAKADLRSTVHRPQLCDVVAVKRTAADGSVAGFHMFLGLFTADVYDRNPRAIPMLRDKVASVLAHAGVDPDGHDGRALRHIVDTWPRDDLFQGTEAEILAAARRVLELQVRPQLALFVRHDLFGRQIFAIVFIPRDRFDMRLRAELAGMMMRAYNGTVSGDAVSMDDGPLARVQFVVATDPARTRSVDVPALEAAMAQAARTFSDRLADALAAEYGEADAAKFAAVWGEAFPADYAASHTATAAVHDIRLAEAAAKEDRLKMALMRQMGAPRSQVALKLFHCGEAVPLSDILPLIETLGLRVIEEVPHRLAPANHAAVVLQTLTLQSATGADIDVDARGADLLAALQAVWERRAEADGFNRLVLGAGVNWREAWLLRALFKWCRQVGFPFSLSAVQGALAAHPDAVRILVDLFHRRFDPTLQRDAAAEARLDEAWTAKLDAIESPDEDRILRRLRTLLDAVLRTNFFINADGPVISLKIDSARAGDMPLPRPLFEIFVHGARMEGCHLRGGPVARGGIRWSDRREDFRTEILGLMKAQMVKNVVIVPVGSKGGFVLKRPPAPTGDAGRDREANAAEGIACYKLLINGMIDITDTLRRGEVVPPANVVRRDGDDPYLVVAADKGTATFSDTANGIAVERGFWLGDAFASGGSIGYDHKVMGITARGAWVNIARHFREIGLDIQADEFTCVGCGDMSGDVFGNGLMVSAKTKLLAAFDHRHIFIDPNPDPAASYAERVRLFKLPRSSWADYDSKLISAGGGIYPRGAKTITLSAEAAAALGTVAGPVEPAALIRAILKAPADLLYFGGIGTYIKASSESQADAGDRASDPLRIDASMLRAKIIGEGANLAVTQAGRIEAALTGVRLNTDALDNSAGVSTSDHEVNIKILLADAMESGRLTERQRVDLLAEMTDEVAEHVLRDNYQQSQSISLDALTGTRDMPAQNALMSLLEGAAILDRAVAGLPDAGTMASRAMSGPALTRPELCTLMAHGKLWLSGRIDASELAADPALEAELVAYFPRQLREGYLDEIRRHRLRRELIGTAITNDLVNRLGPAALGRLIADTDADPVAVCRAAIIAREAFGLTAICTQVEALDMKVPAAAQLTVLAALRRLHEATTRTLLAGSDGGVGIAEAVAALKPGLAELAAKASARAAGSQAAAALTAQGVPAELAALAAALPDLLAAPSIVQLAAARGIPVETAADAWAGAGDAFGIERLRAALAAMPSGGAWGARAVAALSDDLAALQGALAASALRGGVTAAALLEASGHAGRRAVGLAREAAAMPDLAAVTVAMRALRALEPG